jgi:hypothetical protein
MKPAGLDLGDAMYAIVAAAVEARAVALARPELVSQRTVLQIVGVSGVDYLEDARAGGFQSWKVRRLVLSRTADVLAFYARASKPSDDVANDTVVTDDAEARALGRYGARRLSR